MSVLSRARFALAPTVFLGVLAACADGATEPAPTPAPVASVQLAGEASPLTVGTERQLQAIPRDAAGAVLTGRTITWSSSNPAVATVSATGRVVALSAGATVITAAAGGRDGRLTLVVEPAPVGLVELSAQAIVLTRQAAHQLIATARDLTGRPVPEVPVTWTSDDASVAVVTATGRVLAVGSGTARITASAQGRSATATVTVPATVAEVRVTPAAVVLAVGSHRQYAVQAFDDRGRPMPLGAVTWASSTPTVARVTETGVVIGVGVGYATISATVAGVTGSVAVTVVANEWHYDLAERGPIVLAAVTVREPTEMSSGLRREERLEAATFRFDDATSTWTLRAEVATVEISVLQGNTIVATVARREVVDAGRVSGYDWISGHTFLRSNYTGTDAFRFRTAGESAGLRGQVRGFPLTVTIVLDR